MQPAKIEQACLSPAVFFICPAMQMEAAYFGSRMHWPCQTDGQKSTESGSPSAKVALLDHGDHGKALAYPSPQIHGNALQISNRLDSYAADSYG